MKVGNIIYIFGSWERNLGFFIKVKIWKRVSVRKTQIGNFELIEILYKS